MLTKVSESYPKSSFNFKSLIPNPRRLYVELCAEETSTNTQTPTVARNKRKKYRAQETTSDFRPQCALCDFVSTHRYGLKPHMERMHGAKKYFCDLCDYATSYVSYVKIHRDKVHGGKGFPCDLCSRVFVSKDGLNMHKWKIHRDGSVPVHQCNSCDYTSTNKYKVHVQEVAVRSLENRQIGVISGKCRISSCLVLITRNASWIL